MTRGLHTGESNLEPDDRRSVHYRLCWFCFVGFARWWVSQSRFHWRDLRTLLDCCTGRFRNFHPRLRGSSFSCYP